MRLIPRSGLWGHADFQRFWAGDTVSQFGSQISLLAIPLLAAIILDATPLQMGILSAAGTLPALLVGLFVGVWVDRFRRRPIMIAADLGRAAIIFVIPVTSLLGWLNMHVLVAVSLIAGSLTIFFDISYLSYLPSLVHRERLVEANSKLQSTASLAQVAGPGLAGGLVALITAPFALLVDAGSFLVSAFFLHRIQTPEPPPRHVDQTPILRQIRQGMAVVTSHPLLRPLAACDAVYSLGGNIFLAVYVLYLTRDLGLGAGVIGLIFAVGGVGALIGSMLAGPLAGRLGQGPAMIWGQLLFGLTGLAIPVAVLIPRYALPLVATSEFAQWLALLIYVVNAVSVRQTVTPDRLLGRVNATMRFLRSSVLPVGSLLGGVLGGIISVPWTLVVGEFGMLVAVAVLLRSPIRQLRVAELPNEESDETPRSAVLMEVDTSAAG